MRLIMKNLVKTLVAPFLLSPLFLMAIPQGPNATTGGATYTGQNTSELGVNVTSETNVIEWSSFSIADGEGVTFSRNGEPGAYYVWNKVTGSSASQIHGALTANGEGNIYLFNENGVVVGPTGKVLTNSFTATTLDKVGSFNPTGDMRFVGSNSSTIKIEGSVTALDGDITIIGYKIINTGTLTASGAISLAAGRDVLLQPSTNQKVFIQTSTSSGTGTGIKMSGTMEGKSAILVADGNAYTYAINHSGVINATSCSSADGRVMLIAKNTASTDKGTVTMSGMIKRNCSSGDGPSLEIYGDTISLTDSASINLSGLNGGGTITIGDESTYDTDHVHIGGSTSITSSATNSGNGGNITAWAKESLVQIGQITAKGASSGNGGTVSLTTPKYLAYNATTDLRGGASGSSGTLTLTSSALTVGGSANYGSNFAPPNFVQANVPSIVTTSGFQNTLAFSNLILHADGTNETGILTVAKDLTWSSGTKIKLQASNTLNLNQKLTMTGSTHSSNLVAHLDAPTINIGTSARTHTNTRGVSLTSGKIQTRAATTLNLYGGAGGSVQALLQTEDGSNTIAFGSDINVVGGEASSANAHIKGTSVTINGITSGSGDITLQADDCSSAAIEGETINIGKTTKINDIEMTGGLCSSGNNAYIGNQSGGSAIAIAMSGNLSMTGGSTGGSNHARIISNGGLNHNIGITAHRITLTGGSGGSGNTAHIASLGNGGTITITTTEDMTLSGGGSAATAASAYMEAGSIAYNVGRDFSLNGGSGTLNRAYVYGYEGVNATAARNHTLNGGSASLAYAEMKAASGSITLNSSSDSSTFGFYGGTTGSSNSSARMVMAGNGNIKIGTTKSPEFIRFVGGSGGIDVYAHALVEGDGNIDIRADQDITITGGGEGTQAHAGAKITGSGNINFLAGRDVLLTAGTAPSADAYFYATNGVVTGTAGRDVLLIGGSCLTDEGEAFIKSAGSGSGITLNITRNLTQSGRSYIDAGEGRPLVLAVGGTHTILDCAYVIGGLIQAPEQLPGDKYYLYEFLYELFYKLHYFTHYDWYLMFSDNFWDRMMRTSP